MWKSSRNFFETVFTKCILVRIKNFCWVLLSKFVLKIIENIIGQVHYKILMQELHFKSVWWASCVCICSVVVLSTTAQFHLLPLLLLFQHHLLFPLQSCDWRRCICILHYCFHIVSIFDCLFLIVALHFMLSSCWPRWLYLIYSHYFITILKKICFNAQFYSLKF